MRTNRIYRVLALCVTMAIASALLATLAWAAAKGSETKGRAYYRQACRECHLNKTSKGGEVAPMTKTQAQWRTYFQKGKHSGGKEALGKFGDEQKLLDIQTFLINHAADSPQPETCGK